MKKQVIILNGAPNSGKDTIADALAEKRGWGRASFKDQLYECVMKHYGLTEAVEHQRAMELFTDRELKEVPSTMFAGKTPREALIYVSEDEMKPIYGKDFFGIMLRETIRCMDEHTVVVSDGGFEEEIEPLVNEFDVLVIHLHRPECTFEGDSRDFIWSAKHIRRVDNDTGIRQAVRLTELEVDLWNQQLLS